MGTNLDAMRRQAPPHDTPLLYYDCYLAVQTAILRLHTYDFSTQLNNQTGEKR